MEGRLTVVLLLINVSVVQLISNNPELTQAKLRVQDGIGDTKLGKRNEELLESDDISGAVSTTRTSLLKTYQNVYQNCSVENGKCFSPIENSSIKKHNENNKPEDISEYVQPNLLRSRKQTTSNTAQVAAAVNQQNEAQGEVTYKENSGAQDDYSRLICSDKDVECYKKNMLPDKTSECRRPLSSCPSDSTTSKWWVADKTLYEGKRMLKAVCVDNPCPPEKYMNRGKCVHAMAMCVGENVFFDIYGEAHCHGGSSPPTDMADYTKIKRKGNKCDIPNSFQQQLNL